MRVLVTGGAGYIGSHMVKLLADTGADATVLDDLSTGHADAVRGAHFVHGDIADHDSTTRLLAERRIEAVVHFAACSVVPESVADPLKYYARNVGGTTALLAAMRATGVGKIVFSSTASVYGEPQRLPIDESHPTAPVNPYGSTKLAIERMLAECSAAYGLAVASLRYFNAAGAEPGAGLGERHEPETHLVPLVVRAACGRSRSITVFGNDWPTRDGTCVRDYTHVLDLCEAHLRALDWLGSGKCAAFNLGNGEGATVLEVIEAAKRVSGADFPVTFAARRPGDAPALVADAAKARRVLGWRPERPGIDTIVRDAWLWEQHRASHRIAR